MSHLNEKQVTGLIRIIIFVGVILYIALPVVSIYWVNQPFLGMALDEFAVVNSIRGSEWVVNEIDPPLYFPERIVSVNEIPVETEQEVYALVWSMAVGEQVVLQTAVPPETHRTYKPDIAPRAVNLTLQSFPMGDLWSFFIVPYLIGFVCLVVGIWSFWVRPHAKVARYFLFFMLTLAWTLGGIFDQMTIQWLVGVWVVALPFAGSFSLLFACNFPHENTMSWRKYEWLLLSPAIILSLWATIWRFSPPTSWDYTTPWLYEYSFVGVAVLASFIIIAVRAYRSPSSLIRQQGHLVLGSAVVSFLPIAVYFILIVLDVTDFDSFRPEIYLAPIVLYPLTIGYVIIRYRLLDVELVLREGATSLIIFTILALALVLILTPINRFMSANNPLLLAMLVAGAALAIEPLRRGIKRGLDRYLFSKPASFGKLVRAYNHEITTAVSSAEVTTLLQTYISKGIPDSNVYLYRQEPKQRRFIAESRPPISEKSIVVTVLNQRNDWIDLADKTVWPTEWLAHEAEVMDLDATLILPLKSEQTLLGFLTIRRQEENSYFTQPELTYLSSLAGQSVLGLERVHIVNSLEARVAELDVISQFSQALNFTVDLDILFELVYVNYQRLLNINNLVVTLKNDITDEFYYAFYVEGDDRHTAREGKKQLVTQPELLQATRSGQDTLAYVENAQQYWFITPLHAGAYVLGTMHVAYPSQEALSEGQKNLLILLADRTAVAIDRLQTRAQLQERAQQMETINQISMSLTSTLEVDPLLELILDKAMELIGAEAGSFMLASEESNELVFKVARGPSSENLVGLSLPIGTGLAGTVAQTGRPILVSDVRQDKRWFSNVDEDIAFTTRTMLTVPLLRHDTVIGVLQTINKIEDGQFNEADQQLLMTFGSQAVVALENARLLAQTDEALQRRVNELFMLQQFDQAISNTLDIDEVLTMTLDWTLRIADGTAGCIALIDDSGDASVRAIYGYERNFTLLDANENLEESLIGYVIKHKRPHLTNNVHDEPLYRASSLSTHSQLTIPILYKSNMIGAIAIESKQFDAFDPVMAETVVRMTTHASAAIYNAVLYEQVNQANQAKSEFVSMVSHELKTPMTSIGGFTQMLLSGVVGELNAQQKNFLDTIAANLRRMDRQIQDLTDISRIETGQLYMQFAPTDLSQVVSETMISVQGPCDAKGIKVHLEYPPELPLVKADSSRLIQVLINLLSNACKYSPENTDTYLRFTTDFTQYPDGTESEEPMVLCVVEDTGYGMSEEDQAKLFSKFFRSENPDIRKAKGTGLGLTITRGIVELHGGRIWFESELGKGTTFLFTVPQSE